MSEYFFLVNVGDGIVSSVCLSKFIPNRLSKSPIGIKYKVAIYIQNLDSTIWKKIDEVEFNNSNNITLKSSSYDLEVGQLAVVVPCNIEAVLDDSVNILPEPLSRKVDHSPVNERATISFKKGNVYSSFQGEFPYQMSKIKGAFLTFDPLILGNSKDIKTKIVFINIHSKILTVKDYFELFVADIKTKETILSKGYMHNSACIIDISSSEDSGYVFYSKETLGIPIFISYDEKGGYLSVEHTHPPAEYFWNNKIEGQRLLKQNWLSQL
jgi:hypothetical protein